MAGNSHHHSIELAEGSIHQTFSGLALPHLFLLPPAATPFSPEVESWLMGKKLITHFLPPTAFQACNTCVKVPTQGDLVREHPLWCITCSIPVPRYILRSPHQSRPVDLVITLRYWWQPLPYLTRFVLSGTCFYSVMESCSPKVADTCPGKNLFPVLWQTTG